MRLAAALRPGHVDLAWLFLLALCTLLIYGSSLGYPFFWVDPIDMGLAASRSIPTIFTSSEGYLYYRPFTFVLWKSLRALFGRFDPFAFHLLHVLMHVLNSWLMFGLAQRVFHLALGPGRQQVGRKRLAAGIAALCFAWYPASYQTVTWVISPQVQAMTFLLASAIAYYDGRTTANRGKIWLSLLLLAIALPIHESAVLFGPILGLFEATFVVSHNSSMPDESQRRFRLWPLGHIALCLTFAAIWFVIPKDPESAVARFEAATGWYLLQGAIWPVAGAVGPWRAWLSGPAWRPLLYVAPPTLLFLCIAYIRGRRVWLFAFGMAWFALMVLPVWATRGIGYVGVSSRIFYTAAPGAILTWTGLFLLQPYSPALPRNHLSRRMWRFGVVALMGVLLWQSASFLAARKELHDRGMAAIWDVVESGRQAGTQLLYVNVPDQMSLRWREYPVGYFPAVLMPVSVDLGQYIEHQTGVQPATQSLSLPALSGLERFPYQVATRGPIVDQAELSRAIRAADAVFFTEYEPEGSVRVVEAGSVTEALAGSYVALFDEKAGLSALKATVKNSRIQLRSDWACLGHFELGDTIFVHLIGPEGQLAAQGDGDPLRGLFPLTECRPGDHIRDIRFLDFQPAGSYTIELGLYNRFSGERFTATDASGQPLPNNAAAINLEAPE